MDKQSWIEGYEVALKHIVEDDGARNLAAHAAWSEQDAQPSDQDIAPAVEDIEKEESEAVLAKRADEDLIWDAYIDKVCVPHGLRTRKRESAHTTLIRNGLKVRSAPECVRAVHGLSCSPHHAGHNDRKKKYLQLRYALKGNERLAESNGERIDRAGTWVVDAVSGLLGTLPSEGRAMLLREIEVVESALTHPTDELRARRAVPAAAHLRDTWQLEGLVQPDGRITWTRGSEPQLPA